jgi:hypothetical protein
LFAFFAFVQRSPFEEGTMRRSRKWNATLESAPRGEVKHSFPIQVHLQLSTLSNSSEGKILLVIVLH